MTISLNLKSFFDTAVLVDDEVPLGEGSNSQSANSKLLLDLIASFQDSDIMISPFRFNAADSGSLERAVRLVLAAKLSIVDWDLENRSGGRINSSMSLIPGGLVPENYLCRELIKLVVERRHEQALQWIVIYTREDTADLRGGLLNYLKNAWMGVHHNLYEEVQELLLGGQAGNSHLLFEINGVFITFMSKKTVTPQEVFDRFVDGLKQTFGPVSLALMSVAGSVGKESHRVMREFSKPFDLSFYFHGLTAGLDAEELVRFLYELYVHCLQETVELGTVASYLEGERTERLRRLLQHCDIDEVGELVGYLKVHVPSLGSKSWNWVGLRDLLAEVQSWRSLKEVVTDDALKSNRVTGDHRFVRFVAAVELLLSLAEWRGSSREASVSEFFDSLPVQAISFTRLLKYQSQAKGYPIKTGSIYFDRQTDSYLLCITPYCDTARPKTKVDNHFKFLIGIPEPNITAEIGKIAATDSKHGTFVPKAGSRGMDFVVWYFYRTEVLTPAAFLLSDWIASGCSPEYIGQWLADMIPALTNLLPEQALAVLAHLGHAEEVKERVLEVFDQVAIGFEEPSHIDPSEVLHGLNRYEFVGRLRKEYVQQILNEYVAYHSRAGVPELYYKERAKELYSIFHKAHHAIPDYERLLSAYELTHDQAGDLWAWEVGRNWLQELATQATPEQLKLLTPHVPEMISARKRFEALATILPLQATELLDLAISGVLPEKDLLKYLTDMILKRKTVADLLAEARGRSQHGTEDGK